MCYILSFASSAPGRFYNYCVIKTPTTFKLFTLCCTSHQSSLQRSASAARSAALVRYKNQLLNASYLDRPEGKSEAELLNVTYMANPEESTEADWLYNFCPGIPKPEVEIKKQPQETIDTRQYSLVMSHKVREPSIFYGTSEKDGQDWLKRFEIVATANGCRKEQNPNYDKLNF